LGELIHLKERRSRVDIETFLLYAFHENPAEVIPDPKSSFESDRRKWIASCPHAAQKAAALAWLAEHRP